MFSGARVQVSARAAQVGDDAAHALILHLEHALVRFKTPHGGDQIGHFGGRRGVRVFKIALMHLRRGGFAGLRRGVVGQKTTVADLSEQVRVLEFNQAHVTLDGAALADLAR